MNYRKRLIIFFSAMSILAIILITFFVFNVRRNVGNLDLNEFIPQDAKEFLKVP